MKQILHNRSLYVVLVAVAVVIVVAMMITASKNAPQELVTTTVELGDVRELVSVSGIAEAEQSAELAFPATGIVSSVAVEEGDVVNAGDVLMTLEARALEADRQDALAAISRAVAERDELLAGPSNEERGVTAESVDLATAALARAIEDEELKIANARRALLSNELTAFSDNEDEDAAPPTVSGTYTCEAEGVYYIDVFSSAAQSGFSYRLSGLETGTFVGSVDQAIALGACGLRIQFDDSSSYFNTDWTIEIPNTKSSSYVTALNTYNLALTQAESAITLAEQEVALAEANATNDNAPARIEAVARANADIAQAQARLARIEADLEDRILRAPFAGTITEIDILPGETVTTEPVVTLLAAADFEVTARIPEIDIGKLVVGQKAEMVFDARDGETVTGIVDFISLKATEIDGVAYYEAMVTLDEVPAWIRSGLNADIDIVVSELTDVLRLPKRFVSTVDEPTVLTPTDDPRPRYRTASTTIEILMEGNDGFVAITGLSEGDIVVAP